jgi:hypothetical protein
LKISIHATNKKGGWLIQKVSAVTIGADLSIGLPANVYNINNFFCKKKRTKTTEALEKLLRIAKNLNFANVFHKMLIFAANFLWLFDRHPSSVIF